MMREMKDSGLVWIRRIPTDWQINKIKFIIESGENGMKIGPFGSALKGLTLSEGPVKIYNQANLIAENFDISKHYISAETYERLKSYTINAGDILFSMMGTIGKCRIMPKGKPIGIMDSHLLKARLNTNKVLPEFFVYAFDKDRNPATLEQLIYSSQGSIMNGLNSFIVKNIKLAIPNKNEQQQIVSYLDAKCDAIDKAIAYKRSVIEKLKEYRTAVITKAVTKGLNPDVEMKDSGIEWIGQIPYNWSVTKIKFIADNLNGDRGSNYPSGEDIKDSGIVFATSNNIHDLYFDANPKITKYITREKYNSLRGVKLKTGDLVFCLRGSIGLCSMNLSEEEGTIASSLMVLRSHSIESKYLNYYLNSKNAFYQTDYVMNGSCAANLAAESVRRYWLPKPSQEEQQQIVDYLDDKCNKIDTAIQQQKQVIAKLEEYRKSVIYYAVTGKIDCGKAV